MSLFQRIAQYLANEVITKNLARSHTFQRFAVRTHEHVSKTQELAKEQQKHATKSFNATSKQAAAKLDKHKSFASALKDELFKQWGLKK